jgi:hypothetical protein
MNALLRRYIREALLEVQANPAVANQLPGTPKPGEKGKEDKEDEDEVEELDEFSGAGAIAGFAAPLGYTSMDAEGPGADGERSKRKKPNWH